MLNVKVQRVTNQSWWLVPVLATQLAGVCRRHRLSSLLVRFYLLRDTLGKREQQLYQRLKIILAFAGIYLSTRVVGSPGSLFLLVRLGVAANLHNSFVPLLFERWGRICLISPPQSFLALVSLNSDS